MREMKDSNIPWVGSVPQSWSIEKAKYHFKNIKEIAGVHADMYERLSLTMKGVLKRAKNDSDGLQPKDFDTYQVIEKDNLIFKLIDLQNISTSRVGLSPYTGLVSPAYIRLVANGRILPKFAEYYFLSLWYRNIFNHLGDEGVRSSLNATELLNIAIPVPSIDEQRKIISYLGVETSRLDSLVSDIQTQIEILAHYKESIITEAVTKGLNPNVEMKDSGIDWIGSIPIHWSIVRISNIYTESISTGRADLPILTVSIKNGVSDRELDEEESLRVFVRSEDRSKYKHVIPGDLAYNMMRAWQGAFGAVRVEGMISPAYVVARPKIELDSRYMEYLIRTPSGIEEMHRYSYGVADFRLRLYWSQFKNIKVCLPPYCEQVEIANYIDNKCTQIESMIAKKNEQIEVLEAYKKSLIYEYVTGKKEVTYA